MKKLESIKNPFLTVGYRGSDFFCDRKSETAWIQESLDNGNHVSLISMRRMGKTGLIRHVISMLPRDWQGLYIDIQATETMEDFFNEFVSSALQTFPEKSGFGRKLWKLIKSFRPVVSYDTLTGNPQVSLNLQDNRIMPEIETVLRFLDGQNVKIVIAIDEFQQVLNYPEGNVEAWLRSKIQSLNNIRFIFSGSLQHIMEDMFTSPGKPFYRSTQLLKLGPIPRDIYADFIVEMFGLYKKEISTEIAGEMIDWARNHTYYVQQLCNRVFSVSGKKVSKETWLKQAYLILKEQESVFFAYRNMLTKQQWQLLNAIANEGRVFQPTSKEFLQNHTLPSSAGVLRALKSLQNYELIIESYNSGGNRFYQVYDVFLDRWLRDYYKS